MRISIAIPLFFALLLASFGISLDVYGEETCTHISNISLYLDKLQYTQGETILINTWITPNEILEIYLKNPNNQEVFADVLKADEFGQIQIKIPLPNDAKKGIWKVFALSSSSEQQDVVFLGVDAMPEPRLSINPYMLNYAKGGQKDASFLIAGKPQQTIHIDVFDSSDRKKLDGHVTALNDDGRCDYYLDLDGYDSGVYTIKVYDKTEDASSIFSVGLQPTLGVISIDTSSDLYYSGMEVFLNGKTNPNIDLTIEVSDGFENLINWFSVTADENGIIDASFYLPDDAKHGNWRVKATSGPNFDYAEFVVIEKLQDREKLKMPELDLPAVILSPFYQNDVVVIGEIISLDTALLASQGIVTYHIDVQEKLKNPKPSDMIAAISDYQSEDETKPVPYTEIHLFNDPVFDPGDVIFAYLTVDEEGKYHLSPDSFALSKNSYRVGPPPTHLWPLGLEKYKFAVGEEVIFPGLVKKAFLYYLTLNGEDANIYGTIYDPDGNVYDSKIIIPDTDGRFEYPVRILNKNAVAGEYIIEIKAKGTGWQTGFDIFVPKHMMSPLKQIPSGIQIEDIRCKDSLVLLIKHDDFPACVKPETKIKLIERGWVEKILNIIQEKPASALETGSESLLTIHVIKQPTTPQKIIVTVGDKPSHSNVLPLLTTEITQIHSSAQDEVTVWAFQPFIDTRGKDWDFSKHVLDILDKDGNDALDRERLPENYSWDDIGREYPLVCDYVGDITAKSRVPLSVPIKDGITEIHATYSNMGLLPDKQGLYTLEFASLHGQEIVFLGNVDVISSIHNLCHLESESSVTAYYDKVVFKVPEQENEN